MSVPLPHAIIAEALFQRQLSQKDAAQQMGISSQYLSEIVSGERRISIPFAKKAEEVLKIDGSVANFDFGGKIQKPDIRKTTFHRISWWSVSRLIGSLLR
jgi:transcriptional regulator with XRE-family HTH domain